MYKSVKMIAILTIVVGVGFSFTNVSQGQEIEYEDVQYGMVGGSIIDIKDLNSRLEKKGYPKISDNFISLGGGGHVVINNKVIIGGEGYSLIEKEAISGSYKTQLNVDYGFLNLGYIIYSTKKLKVYPLLGLGAGEMSLKIVEKGTSSSSFDDILNNPKRGVDITTGGLLLNLAIGTDYLLNFGGDNKEKWRLVFGLRLGYTFVPVKGDWKMDEVGISGGPDIGITGPYIHLVIGGGGFGKKIKGK
jgi:hypothetical protein